MLNPVFSGAHMRNLTPLFYDVAGRLRVAFESQVEHGPKDLDVLTWMGRTALELIGGSIQLTHSIRSSPAFNDGLWVREVVPFLPYLSPAWFRRMLLHLVPIPAVQRMKSITDTMSSRTEEI
uniref:Cytochrome P450 monooxygenase CYP52X1 n=1 Tax=Ganoderma boninense TaxID=34458 RepID=A0A5K1JVE1_9APHY|nr:Cytochrome P450 monooxygenase CYP52X1 [Ganoderma boninense]